MLMMLQVGIVYVVLAVMFFTISYFRHRHSRHDFADQYSEKSVIVTQGQQNKRIFGRPFVTAGWIVVAVSIVVAVVEIALLVLIFQV